LIEMGYERIVALAEETALPRTSGYSLSSQMITLPKAGHSLK
jgi:hypothetical protein